MNSRPAIFLDKDGTLLEDVPYNVDPHAVRLMAGAAEGLRLLAAGGYRIVVVSNQAGAAHGYFTVQQLCGLQEHLTRLLRERGIVIDGFYWCPHHPRGSVAELTRNCTCRKPQPGLIRQAAADLDIDVHESWMIGDILDDVEAGRRAGCRTVLIDNGNETVWEMTPQRTPDHTAPDLVWAARVILTSWQQADLCEEMAFWV